MPDRDDLALQVIDLAKAAVLADNHFLSPAVGRLHVAPMQLPTSFATDGYFLAFDPKHVLAHFKRAGLPPKRNLLHTVAHCLFLHPYVGASVDRPLWDLACDIAAQRVVEDLLGPWPGERGVRMTLALQRVERDMGCRISAEKVYRRLRDGWWADCAGEWMGLMRSDSHDPWYAPAASGDDERGEGTGAGTEPSGGVGSVEGSADSTMTQAGSGSDQGRERADDGEDAPSARANDTQDASGNAPAAAAGDETGAAGPTRNAHEDGNAVDNARASADDSSGSDGEPQGSAVEGGSDHAYSDTSPAEGTPANDGIPARGRQHGHAAGASSVSVQASDRHATLRQIAAPDLRQQQAEWRQVATSLAVNLQTLSARRGGKLAGFVEDLQGTARQRTSYRNLLRQFAIPGEVMRTSEDEFDNVFYTYGLQLYGDTPLIEPLEYREERRVREFVIVIDTSASVQGDVVRSFVGATFDVLKDCEAFFDHVHVRILQCDAQVQTDDRIDNLNDLEQWGRSMRIAGGGGTDFRPAFDYVDALMDQGAFHDLGGLVYFTDGQGTFPARMPAYRTAFVFYDEDLHDVAVPPWAVRIVLDSDAIRDAVERA